MASLPVIKNTSSNDNSNFKLESDKAPLIDFTNTVEKLNINLNKFTNELKTTIGGLTKGIEKNNKILKDGAAPDKMENFLNNLFPKQDAIESKKIYSNLDKTIANFNSTIESSFSKERTQSLFNLTFKQVAKDTLGTITDKFTDSFKNNALVKGFTNLKDAFKVLKGGASSLIGSAAGRRTERTQEQIELDAEKIEREERTNELLEDILEALLKGNKLEKDKEKNADDGGSGLFPLITAGAIAAGAGATSILKDYPGTISAINSLRKFFNAIKEFELPKISQIKSWIDEFRNLIKTKITGTDDVAKTTTWVDDLMKWGNEFKESIKSKLKTPAAADELDGELSKTSKWVDGLTNTFRKYKLTLADNFDKSWANTKDFFSKLSDDIFEKYKLPNLGDEFINRWNKFSDFFINLKNNIIEKYNLPSLDDVFGERWQKFLNFFDELASKIPTIKLPTIDDIGSKINTMKDGIVNFKNNVSSFIDGTKEAFKDTTKIMNGMKNASKATSAAATAGDYSKATGSLGPVDDYKDFLMGKPKPSSVASVANAANASDLAGTLSKKVTSGLDKTKDFIMGTIPKAVGKALKTLPYAETVLVSTMSPEDVTGVTNEEAYSQGTLAGLKNNYEAAATQAEYSFGPSGMFDLFTGTDTRETRYNLDKDLASLPKAGPLAPLRLLAEAIVGPEYKEKYEKPDTALSQITNWATGIMDYGFFQGKDGEAKDRANILIADEEGFFDTARPDIGGKEGARVIGYGFNYYDGKSVAEHEAEAKARGQELTMTEAQGKEILAGEVDKFHNDLLKVRKKIEGEFIGNIYSKVDDPNRKAALLSLAYQVGIDGISKFQNMWTNLKKANETDDPQDWEAAGMEIIKSKAQRQLQNIQDMRVDEEGNRIFKDTRLDRAYQTIKTGSLYLPNGIMPAKDGAMSYGPRLLLTGEYPNARHNPELTAPINFLKDEMINATERIVSRISQDNKINDMLRETAIEQRLMKMFEKTNEMSNRLKQKEGMETSKARLSVPIVNNVVDNKQVTNNSQSVLMKQTAYNPQNVFRLA